MGLDRSMYSYRSAKGGKAFISWNEKIVMALRGAKTSGKEALGRIKAYMDEAEIV